MGMKYHAIWQAIMAAYTTFCGGLLATGLVSPKVAGVMVLAAAAAQAGTTAYYASTNRVIVPSPPPGSGSNSPT